MGQGLQGSVPQGSEGWQACLLRQAVHILGVSKGCVYTSRGGGVCLVLFERAWLKDEQDAMIIFFSRCSNCEGVGQGLFVVPSSEVAAA